MSNKFFVGVLVAIALVFGIFAFNKQSKDSNNSGANSSATQASNHIQGQGKTGVVLAEYGDFQCPACSSYHPIVKQVVEKYKQQITFQFRNFPLIQIHPNAMAAHRAAEAASKQGRFWEMHDKLYETQNDWASGSNVGSIFENYASALSLDLVKFKQDVASQEVNDIINADREAGNKLGANSTPTFILDGAKIDNPRSAEDFYKIIDEAIQKKTQS